MQTLVNRIEQLVEFFGRAVSWLTSGLALLICVDVVLRYLFNFSSASMFELEWHLFSLIFLLGAAYALKADKHVRVDIFYSRFSEKGKAWVNLIGTILFLIPLCVVVIMSSVPFVANSYNILEGSPDPGGLPFRFLVKAAIPIGFSLLLLQAISLCIRSIFIIRDKPLANV